MLEKTNRVLAGLNACEYDKGGVFWEETKTKHGPSRKNDERGQAAFGLSVGGLAPSSAYKPRIE